MSGNGVVEIIIFSLLVGGATYSVDVQMGKLFRHHRRRSYMCNVGGRHVASSAVMSAGRAEMKFRREHIKQPSPKNLA